MFSRVNTSDLLRSNEAHRYVSLFPSLYPLLFFPAQGKILAWAGRKKYLGREGKI